MFSAGISFQTESGDISQTGRQRILDRWSYETKRALTIRFQITFMNFQTVNDRRVRDVWRAVEVTVRKGGHLVIASEFHGQPLQFT